MATKKSIDKNLARNLLKWVSRFEGVPILVVGDIMLDRYIRGPVDRISPEAPVPVIQVKEESCFPGGAGNVASNIASLGGIPMLVSLRGDDQEGENLISRLTERSVRVNGILIDRDRPTITKTRLIAGHQHVARMDIEKRDSLSPRTADQLLKTLITLLPWHRGVVISDYGKGVVTRPLIQATLKHAHKQNAVVTVDPKIEHFMRYRGVDCLTPNAKEAYEGMRSLPPKDENDLIRLGWSVVKKLNCQSLIITRGEKGMALFHKTGRLKLIPAYAREVFDVTGAGDTVVATFALARAVGAPFEEAAHVANIAASIVVGKLGTAVTTRDELSQLIRSL